MEAEFRRRGHMTTGTILPLSREESAIRAKNHSLEVLILRGLPLLCLPLAVGLLQPDSMTTKVPLVLVALVLGAVITVEVPRGVYATMATFATCGLLLSAAYLHELVVGSRRVHTAGDLGHSGKQHQHHTHAPQTHAPSTADPRAEEILSVMAGAARNRSQKAYSALQKRAVAPRTSKAPMFETFSVVLPCANERDFAQKTIYSIWENTDRAHLKEIIVVDDGSQPPLKQYLSDDLLAGGADQPPLKLLRHETQQGLILSKQHGADVAVGDVIAFFDCHVKPRRGWERAFLKQMHRRGDHRTVVVPTITSLTADTWQDLDDRSAQAVFPTLGGQFEWVLDSGRDVPMMSGGLLAMSKRWWLESGGYDKHMHSWGGENIDQSLRTWLCGGRIEVAEGAYVAHMWRDPDTHPETVLRYAIPTSDVMRNKARALAAWYGDFSQKWHQFPEYEKVQTKESWGDMRSFDELKRKLRCKTFPYYLSRFSYLFIDGGVIPREVFQLKEVKSGRCLERVYKGEVHKNPVILGRCTGGPGEGEPSELQLWHGANRDLKGKGGSCCSGISSWNFIHCLEADAVESFVGTKDCAVLGHDNNQLFSLEADSGLLLWRVNEGDPAEGCVAALSPQVSAARLSSLGTCEVSIQAAPDAVTLPSPSEESEGLPSSFLLKTTGENTGCGFASPPEEDEGEEADATPLEFRPCDEERQTFEARSYQGHFEIVHTLTELCLDAAGGNEVLLFPCASESDEINENQLWQSRGGHLVWSKDDKELCLSSQQPVKRKEYRLESCTNKVGQHLRKHDQRGDTFELQDSDEQHCLSADEDQLVLGECGGAHRWRELKELQQLQEVTSGQCLDRGLHDDLSLKPCCASLQGSQRFQVDGVHGWVQGPKGWDDNGHHRWFQKCLDRLPLAPMEIVVKPCHVVRKAKVRWQKVHAFTPLEWKIWERSEKPPPGAPVLGGDAEPP